MSFFQKFKNFILLNKFSKNNSIQSSKNYQAIMDTVTDCFSYNQNIKNPLLNCERVDELLMSIVFNHKKGLSTENEILWATLEKELNFTGGWHKVELSEYSYLRDFVKPTHHLLCFGLLNFYRHVILNKPDSSFDQYECLFPKLLELKFHLIPEFQRIAQKFQINNTFIGFQPDLSLQEKYFFENIDSVWTSFTEKQSIQDIFQKNKEPSTKIAKML